MNYSDYLVERFKCGAIILGGIALLMFGLPLEIVMPGVGLIAMISGLVVTGIGIFKINQFNFEREEGNKVYVMEGRYR